MKEQEQINFNRVAEAIHFLTQHFREQPSLEAIASRLHMSPFHFQRLFTEWAGVSPKKFLQYLTLKYAKSMLQKEPVTLVDAALETGLSGTGRLHDLFVNIEGMTPGEYKNGGESLHINYSYAESPFGELIFASTQKGICHIAFVDERQNAFAELHALYPGAVFIQAEDSFHQIAQRVFSGGGRSESLRLHLKGSPFQLKVWEALLTIPAGCLSSYRSIASSVGQPHAQRAVGTAIGKNPVALIIPCHRVIQSAGAFGGYRWGPAKKMVLIGWEAARVTQDQ